MNTHQAKKLVKAFLAQQGKSNRLTAKTIHFPTGRGLIFVKVHDWDDTPAAEYEALDQLAHSNGFRMEYQHKNAIGQIS